MFVWVCVHVLIKTGSPDHLSSPALQPFLHMNVFVMISSALQTHKHTHTQTHTDIKDMHAICLSSRLDITKHHLSCRRMGQALMRVTLKIISDSFVNVLHNSAAWAV